jgi:hypothetical protein
VGMLQVDFTDINKGPGMPARTQLPSDEPKAPAPMEKRVDLPLLSTMS